MEIRSIEDSEFVTHINTISKEQTFILFQGEEITLEAEEKWLEGELKKIKEGKAVQLLLLLITN